MRQTVRFILVMMVCTACALAFGAEPKRTQASIKKERTQTSKRIADTQKKIGDNTRRTRKTLDDLNSLNAQISGQQRDIAAVERRIDTLSHRISRVNDSIADSQSKLGALRQGMAESLRAMRTQRQKMNALSFVFSAGSFNEAMRRIGYLTQLNTWRDHKVKTLSLETERLKGLRENLAALQAEQTKAKSGLTAAYQVLDTRRGEANKLVSQLRTEGATLQKMLSEDRRKMSQLDRELDRLIAAEAAEAKRKEELRKKKEEAAKKEERKKKKEEKSTAKTPTADKAKTTPADKTKPAPKGDGSFAANRGRMPMPVTGSYTIVSSFGRTKHAELSNIEVENSGIDISASAGSSVRAVHDGTVSSIFEIDGYDTVVIVRHGNYLTVYAGISGPAVSKGQTVKAGQTLGRLHTDGAGRSVLHFEVRNERNKLNPLEWLAR